MKIAALTGALLVSSFAFADDASHVTVIELQHTQEAMKATYNGQRKVPLPRLVVFDGKRRPIIAETGFHTSLDKELHEALSRDRLITSPITLDMVLAETHDAHGATLTADQVPQADIYVVDYWAEWCGPCHMLAHTLNNTLNHWSSVRSVWIKIESDPNKKENRRG